MIKNWLSKQVKKKTVSIIIFSIRIAYPSLLEMRPIFIRLPLISIFNPLENKKKKESKPHKCISSSLNSSKMTILVSSNSVRILSSYLKNKLLFTLEILSSIMQNKLKKWQTKKLKTSFPSTSSKFLIFSPFGWSNNRQIHFLYSMRELLKEYQ